jgi:hypothetical protein
MKYPIVAPRKLIESINEYVFDAIGGDELEEMFPGLLKGVGKLNVDTGAADKDEGFAAWNFFLDQKGYFCIEPIQPHYVKGSQKKFVWDGKKFV